ncbi:S8 family serine peptidase [Sphingomonas sp.]|uniref:S8 family serine peptidase n=1 Tax=Sphingomonas sp. TaxID=28214 RepID=UPI003D6CC5F9
MRASLFLALAIGCLIGADAGPAYAQVNGQAQQPVEPQPRRGIGLGGIGLSISLGKKRRPPVLEQMDQPVDAAVNGELIITIRGDAAEARRIADRAQVGLAETWPLESLDTVMAVVRLRFGDSAETATARLRAINTVQLVVPNTIYQTMGRGESKPASAPAWFTSARIPPDSVSGPIAMIDTPIDFSVEPLKAVRANQSFFGVAANAGVHGTAVASLLVGQRGVTGSARGAQLFNAAAFSQDARGATIGVTSNVAKALNAVVLQRPAVLVLAFGGNENPLLAQLLDVAHQRGICVVAAVGNGGPNTPVAFPASHRASFAITAVDERFSIYAYASRGNAISTAGVGVAQLAAVPGGYRVMSGTSFAAASVGGALMHLDACARDHRPDQARSIITDAALDLGPRGRDPIFGAGLFRLPTGR